MLTSVIKEAKRFVFWLHVASGLMSVMICLNRVVAFCKALPIVMTVATRYGNWFLLHNLVCLRYKMHCTTSSGSGYSENGLLRTIDVTNCRMRRNKMRINQICFIIALAKSSESIDSESIYRT